MSTYRYKGSKIWTYDFVFDGHRVRESSKTSSRTLAKDIEKKRKRELREGTTGIKRAKPRLILSVAVSEWLELKKNNVALSTHKIAINNLQHLLPVFGNQLLVDIDAVDIAAYQQTRIAEGAAAKTINLEMGTLRAVMKRAGQWERVLPDFSMLAVREDVGRALHAHEDAALETACRQSRSRCLAPFVVMVGETGARAGVTKRLRWEDIATGDRCIRFGKDKTPAGTGRVIPLSQRALRTLDEWAANFPDRQSNHFIFPKEMYGAKGHKFGKTGAPTQALHFATDPTRHMGDIKHAWEVAKERAGDLLELRDAAGNPAPLQCRMHDLRHTAVSRMLNAGIPIAVVAKIVGWSASTMVSMAKLYGHFSVDEMRGAVESISASRYPVFPPVLPGKKSRKISKLLI